MVEGGNSPSHGPGDVQQQRLFQRLHILKWLEKVTLCFPVDGGKVSVIERPDVFYETLLEKSRTAKKRVTLASLYLGTGRLEQQLVDSLDAALLRDGQHSPKVQILLDATRGSRGDVNSRTMLLPLVEAYGERCRVHLYHTPSLNGILKQVLPQRWNETVGLQHMKLYVFDDSVLISGANLSHDYFTNRQDRYLLVDEATELADFCDRLVGTVCRFSFRLGAGDRLDLDAERVHHPFEGGTSQQFAAEAGRAIQDLFKDRPSPEKESRFSWPVESASSAADTWIFPLVQMGQLGVETDSACTRRILESIPADAEMSLATGYFNLTQDYMDSILNVSRANVHILMAHPSANGFLGAAGFAGGIPSAYTLLASQFYQQVVSGAQQLRIRLWEYQRLGWTFHAKGLWMSFVGVDSRPCFTLIGSPNFGYRSVYRDLEAQLAVVTVNSKLRDQLDGERRRLMDSGRPVDGDTYAAPERAVPLWVRLVIGLFRHFF